MDPETALPGLSHTTGRRNNRSATVRLVGGALRTGRGRVGAALVGFVLLLAALGPLVAPYSPTDLGTAPFAPPSSAHMLGTDVLGRDVLSRVLWGGWELLLMAGFATALGVAGGAIVGVVAAFYGGWLDGLLMRTSDVLLAFPQLVFALLLVSIAGPSPWLIVLAVAIAHVPQVARVIRSAALDVCEQDYVRCGSLYNLSNRRILREDVAPNVIAPLMVETGLRVTFSIVIIAGLSFLGFGLQPPQPTWGAMINENRLGIESNPWGVVAPVMVLGVLTVGMNLFTDAVSRAAMGARGGAATPIPVEPMGLGNE